MNRLFNAGVVFTLLLSASLVWFLFNREISPETANIDGNNEALDSDVQSKIRDELQVLDPDVELEGESPVFQEHNKPPRIDSEASFQLSEIIRLSDAEYPHKPAIAVSGNHVYVVWADSDVFLTRSQDGGETFGLPHIISTVGSHATNPSVVINSGIVRVEWEDADKSQGNWIFSIESHDAGSSFGPASRRAPISSGRLAKILTPFGDMILEVYQASGESGENLFVRASIDGGESFGRETYLSKELVGRSMRPVVLTTSSAVHILWEQWTKTPFNDPNIHTENLYISTTDDGITFQEPIKLTHYEIGFENHILTTRLVASESHVYVTWNDFPGEEIFFRTSSDSGLSFSEIVVLSNPGKRSFSPKMLGSDSSVYVLWSECIPHENDGLDFFIGPTDIMLRVSLDGGISFSEIIDLSSTSDKVSGPRQVQLLNDMLFVVWEERPPSFGKAAVHSEILFLRVDLQSNNDEIPVNQVAMDPEEALVATNDLGNGVFISLSLERSAFELGDLVTMRWHVTNNGSQTITFEVIRAIHNALGFLITNETGWAVWSDNDFLIYSNQINEVPSTPGRLPGLQVSLEPGDSWYSNTTSWNMIEKRVSCQASPNACWIEEIGQVSSGKYDLSLRAPIINSSFDFQREDREFHVSFEIIE